jgi:hypothetical protein
LGGRLSGRLSGEGNVSVEEGLDAGEALFVKTHLSTIWHRVNLQHNQSRVLEQQTTTHCNDQYESTDLFQSCALRTRLQILLKIN